MAKLVSINPYTEKTNAEFDAFTFDQCTAAVDRARRYLPQWQALSVAERAWLMKSLIVTLRKKKNFCAQIITREMGKPIRQAVAEIDKCILLCEYYGRNSHKFLQDDVIATGAAKSYITFEPLGVILGIMPWNFPFWQVFRFVIPTIIAGNTCLLKHAANVPIAAMEIERLFVESGYPRSVFQTLLADAGTAGQLIEEDKVDGVSLTGSLAAGSEIGMLAGKRIKKLVLELGGSDPFIVLDDADVAGAALSAVRARTANTGQSCIAAKRFIVMEAVAAEFQERFLANLRALKMGNPVDNETDLGPMAKKDQVQELEAQLADALSKGAKAAYGPEPPAGKGFFFRPAMVTEATSDMRVLREEVFGPLAPIIVARDEEEIIALANATRFGLGASIWSRKIQRAEELSRYVEAGFIAINSIVKSDPRLPFGGIKKSGVGRELSRYGLLEFVNVKTVVVGRPDSDLVALRNGLSDS
jgi:succinate-semialdehyde dehydrogenase / glutarate-semialdehyde dehydrogenase